MSDRTKYSVETQSNGNFDVEFNTADLHSLTRGDTTTFEFSFPHPSDDLIIRSGETTTISQGQTELFDEIIVELNGELIIDGEAQANLVTNDGTITVNGELRIIPDVVGILRQFEDYAGSYVEQTTVNGVVRYHEQLPARAEVDSLVVSIRPSQFLRDRNVTGIWCIVDNITDTRPLALSTSRFRLDVTVLAEFGQFDDHTDINNNLAL